MTKSIGSMYNSLIIKSYQIIEFVPVIKLHTFHYQANWMKKTKTNKNYKVE